jgi:hypothetical protein
MGAGSAVYSGLAVYGRVRTIVSAVIVSLFCIAFLIGGIIAIRRKTKYTGKTNGTITSASCSPAQNNNYNCNITFNYQVSGKSYTASSTEVGSQKAVGETIQVEYVPSSPNLAREAEMSNEKAGLMMIGFSLLGLLIAWGLVYASMKYKPFAAVEGAGGVAAGIANLVR